MTLETWKKEFFPVVPNNLMSKRTAIEHSLRKWSGLMPKNLNRHNVASEADYGWIADDVSGTLDIDADTCALCQVYLDKTSDSHIDACLACPLSELLGKPCDYDDNSPYMIWRNYNDPRPMIEALRKLAEE